MDKRQSEYELRKVSEGVFDKSSLMALYKLTSHGHFERMTGIVSTGKEANVYHAIKGSEEVAIKIFAIETSDFRTMDRYLRGDRRFSAWKNKRQLIYTWARKEYCNLSRAIERIRCPRPIAVEKNVLVMGFIGKDGVSAPRLKELPPEDATKFLAEVMNAIKELYSLGIVHGDLSEYNILNWNEEPYIIDFSMGVLLDHPLAEEMLVRDVKNVLAYFRRFGAKDEAGRTDAEIVDWIKKRV